MKYITLLLALISTIIVTSANLSAQENLLKNTSFEEGLAPWVITDMDMGISKIAPEAARTGKNGLRITDKDIKNGSNVFSPTISVTAGKKYQLSFWGRIVEGEGLAGYIIFFDAQNQQLTSYDKKNEQLVIMNKDSKEWKEYSLESVAPEGSSYLKVWLHSFGGAQVVGDMDDISLRIVP